MGVIHCPGDTRYKLPSIPAGWAYDSYSRANNVGGSKMGPDYLGARDTYKKLSAISRPSMTMTFLEDAETEGWGANCFTWVVWWRLGPPQSMEWIDPVPMYHGKVSSFAFSDGHAEMHKWTDPKLIQFGLAAAQGKGANLGAGDTDPKSADYAWVFDRYLHPLHP